jgi:eukaryotic-like serine/threonine-protein kinase
MKPGDVLADRFEIERRAGSGGMGEVFQARDRASGTMVALKVLLETCAGGGERFAREAGVLAELSHPGIVRYIAHGASDGDISYLAMEWLEGEDLARRLERGALTISDALTLATTVAAALAAVHARGVVHAAPRSPLTT